MGKKKNTSTTLSGNNIPNATKIPKIAPDAPIVMTLTPMLVRKLSKPAPMPVIK